MNNLFSKRHLLKALKEAGLPFTYVTLMDLEKKGVVSKPQHMQVMNGFKWRFYTQEEINENIKKIREYKNGTNKK